MLDVKYKYSSVHIDLPRELSNQIIEWGNFQIKDKDLYCPDNGGAVAGRENEIHLTLLYGIYAEKPNDCFNVLKNIGPISVTLKEIGVFEKPKKYNVLMINVESLDCLNANNILKNKIKHKNHYGKYKPHVTIAYIKKQKGINQKGNNVFFNKKFLCNKVVFSSKNGSKYSFDL